MSRFEVYRAESGEYRWRFIDGAQIVAISPGRVRVEGFSSRKKKAVEAALDRALALVANQDERSRARA